MNHDKATEQIEESASLYALGALSQREARSLESHLREGCRVCETQVKRFETLAAAIGLAVDESDPPDYLRDLLSARAEREAQAAPPVVKKPEIGIPPPPAAPVARPTAPAKPKRSIVPWLLAAAAAVALAFMIHSWRQARELINQEHANAAAVREDAQKLRGALELEKGKARELDQINEILGSPGARVVFLAGQPDAPKSAAAVFWDTRKGRCVLNAFLPLPPTGMTYQLWLVTPRLKISIGVIHTDLEGRSFGILDVPRDIADPTAFEITLEPEGGSLQPTMPVYALGKIS